jgi:hypothetical protein
MVSATEALNQFWQQASTEMYQQASKTGSAQSASGDGDKGGGTAAVDAEFEEVK